MVAATKHNNNHFIFQASSISHNILKHLNSRKRGHVHSVFNSSLNLSVNEHLIHVGGLDKGMSPFGIGLDGTDAKNLTQLVDVNDQFFWNEHTNMIVFAKGISIELKEAEQVNHYLQDRTINESHLLNNFDLILKTFKEMGWLSGLADSEADQHMMNEYLAGYYLNGDSESLIINNMRRLEDLANGSTAESSEDIFDFWIGRGSGLTPSGDDLITGLCAVIAVMKNGNTNFLNLLQNYMVKKGGRRTTPVGYEYLMYATSSEFHTMIYDMCQEIMKPDSSRLLPSLKEMEKMGHTSGADTITGVLLGIKSQLTS